LQEAYELFEEALEYHQDEEYDESIRMFKRIFYSFPDHNVGYTSAYNVACGYSLKGDKKNAIKWLEISIKNGFRKFKHMERDTDLDNIRDEPEYKKLIKKYKGED
jgi:tetratricopeptide (TPR) repeat protein